MKTVLLWISIVAAFLFGISTLQTDTIEIHNESLSHSFLEKDIPIIDIRTPKEWEETGVVPDSHLITFYNEDKTYNEIKFLFELEKIVNVEDTFAILCRSGNRSNQVSRFLYSQGFTNVINLAGGIKMGKKNGLELAKVTNNTHEIMIAQEF
jgi:rhodanese-related sulfurtransferase